MLWVLKRTVSMRRFFWAPKTYAKYYKQGKIYNFTLKIFVNLNLCIIFTHNKLQVTQPCLIFLQRLQPVLVSNNEKKAAYIIWLRGEKAWLLCAFWKAY